MIGVERKRLSDMLSSIRTGRFSGEQLPKLIDTYEHSYLIVEGVYRCNYADGALEQPWGNGWHPVRLSRTAPPIVSLELYAFLNTIATLTPTRVLHSHCEKDTVEQVVGLQRWWGKPWDKHHGHVALHSTPDQVLLGKAGTVRRVAATLNGVGWEKSGAISDRFKTVEEMVMATVKDWEKLPGFGKVMARKVWGQLREMYDSGGGME
jgi:ERCC4-type nuclease